MAERDGKLAIYRKILKEDVVTMTKAGNVDGAIALQNETDSLSSAAALVPIVKGRESGFAEIERIIPFPEERPKVVNDPFAESRWNTSMVIARGKYRLRNSVSMRDHGKGLNIFMAPGGDYSRSEGEIHVLGGLIISEGCRFYQMLLRAVHTGGMYFADCYLKDSTIGEKGTLYGNGNYDSVWYFENCNISGSLHSGMFNINYLGLCMTRCSLDR